MAYIFGDSFDFYATPTDAFAGWWDSGIPGNILLGTGRFAGGRSIRFAGGQNNLVKSSGVNDAVHHLNFAIMTDTLTNTSNGDYLQLMDGAANQCCIVFRFDGVMLLQSGAPGGATLATYPGAINLISGWTAFEIEVVIHNTAGSITVRKNGSTGTPDFTATGLNTRGGTANNYANRLALGLNVGGVNQWLDDLLWRSDPTSVPWLGDVRAYQLMPTSDASVQFAPAPNPVAVSVGTSTNTISRATGIVSGRPFVASQTGVIATATVGVGTGGTGNLKAAIYDNAHNVVLGTSNAVVNPTAGNVPLTFASPVAVTKGTTYFIVADQDFTIVFNGDSTATGYSGATAYGSFPAAGLALAGSQNGPPFVLNITPTNSSLVSETQEDGTTSYVYDATVGHADLYDVADLPANTLSIVAMTTRAYMEKSDAGARTGRVQLKSGGTTVTGDLVLSSSFSWCSRTDTVDPNTSAAWTLANANLVQCGPVVAA